MLKSAPVHKSYVCSFCKSTIKAMQKFAKCTCKLHVHTLRLCVIPCLILIPDCGQTCHQKCSGQLPNNCGLPAELVDFAVPSSAKKSRQQVEREREEEEEEVLRERVEEKPRSVSLVRRPNETTKLGKVYVPKYVCMHALQYMMRGCVLRMFLFCGHYYGQ